MTERSPRELHSLQHRQYGCALVTRLELADERDVGPVEAILAVKERRTEALSVPVLEVIGRQRRRRPTATSGSPRAAGLLARADVGDAVEADGSLESHPPWNSTPRRTSDSPLPKAMVMVSTPMGSSSTLVEPDARSAVGDTGGTGRSAH